MTIAVDEKASTTPSMTAGLDTVAEPQREPSDRRCREGDPYRRARTPAGIDHRCLTDISRPIMNIRKITPSSARNSPGRGARGQNRQRRRGLCERGEAVGVEWYPTDRKPSEHGVVFRRYSAGISTPLSARKRMILEEGKAVASMRPVRGLSNQSTPRPSRRGERLCLPGALPSRSVGVLLALFLLLQQLHPIGATCASVGVAAASTMRPLSSTMISSAFMIVDSRWAITSVVRPRRPALDLRLDGLLQSGVERRGGFVENRGSADFSIARVRRHALLFACRRRLQAALADPGPEYLPRRLADEVLSCGPRGGLDLPRGWRRGGRSGCCVQRVVEQHRVLRDDSDRRAQAVLGQAAGRGR